MALTKFTEKLISDGFKASISGSDTVESSSFSTRITDLVTASSSFSGSIATLRGAGSLQGVGTSDSPTFAGATITGTLTAQEVHTEFESASILFTSGSTQFGNSSDDVHDFLGNTISGSATSTGSFGSAHFRGVGGVGIGTVNPASMLHLHGTDPILRFQDSAGGDVFGIYNSDSLGLGFYNFTDSRQDLTIDGSGNIGIGNTAASTINSANNGGRLVVGDGSGNEGMTIYSGNGSGEYGILYFADGTSGASTYQGWLAYLQDVNALTFATSGSEKMRITPAGNVGIGDTSPTSESGFGSPIVRIKGSTNPSFVIKNTSSGGEGLMSCGDEVGLQFAIAGNATASHNVIKFRTGNTNSNFNSTERMRITSAGNVGIGHTTPQYGLTMAQGNADAQKIGWEDGSNNKRGAILVNSDNDAMEFMTGTSDAVRMTITSGGNVFIGDTANAKATIGLTINQGANDDEILALKSSDVAHGMTDLAETDTYFSLQKASASQGGVNAQAFSDNTEYAWYMQGATLASANTAKSTSAVGVITMAAATKSGTGRTAVTTNGNLVVMKNDGTTRFIFDGEGSGHADVEWTTYSDERLKKNVEDIPYGLNELNKLEPKIYDRYSGKIEDGKVELEDNSFRQIGFIAQDVKKIIPELIKDIDESESFYSLDDGKLVSVLVKAVQELSSQVTDLKKEIEELKS